MSLPQSDGYFFFYQRTLQRDELSTRVKTKDGRAYFSGGGGGLVGAGRSFSFSLLKNCRTEEEKKEIDDLIVFVCRGLADLPSRTKLPQ